MLIIGNASAFFTIEFIKNAIDLSKLSVDVVNIENSNVEMTKQQIEFYKSNDICVYDYRVLISRRHHFSKLLYSRIKNSLKMYIVRKYDIVNLHYITEEAVAVSLYAGKKTKIISTVYGSDVLRANSLKKKVLKYVFKKSSYITAATDYLKEYILNHYGKKLNEKIYKVDFGNTNIEYVKQVVSFENQNDNKSLFGFPLDKVIIFVGYNGNPAHRHIDILHTFEKLPKDIISKIYVVFHCSYALGDEYKNTLEYELNESVIEGRIVTDFLSGLDLIRFRNCGDIMLNLQATDVLSGSMLEYLAVGSVVIKGDWLHYPELDSKGAYILSIDSFESLNNTVIDIVMNYNSYRNRTDKNFDIVYSLISWEYQRPRWNKLLSMV